MGKAKLPRMSAKATTAVVASRNFKPVIATNAAAFEAELAMGSQVESWIRRRVPPRC